MKICKTWLIKKSACQMMFNYIRLALLLLPVSGIAQVKKAEQDSLKKNATDSISNTVKLKEVVIKSKVPLLQVEVDKIVVNVSAMISSASSNTLEVLEKTPGITVDAQGNISMNGRGGVMVLIDGRQTYMSGTDLAQYLKSLPGGNLDKIELMDNPPARYDAAGNGVINIKLKKARKAGFVGSIASGYSQGRHARTNNSLNLNYNSKKFNSFANLGYSMDRNYGIDNFSRSYFNEEGSTTSRVLLENEQQYSSKGINANIGLDYLATANTTFGLQVNLNNGMNDGEALSLNRNYGLIVLDSTGRGLSLADGTRKNFVTNMNMLHKFGKAGGELSVDASYLKYLGQLDQSLETHVFQPNGALINNDNFIYDLPSRMNIYTMKSDYSISMDKVKLEAGLKWSTVTNDNLNTSRIMIGNQAVVDNGRSNHFKYREDFAGAYISGQKVWNSFGLQMGLRAEYTNGEGKQLGNSGVAGSSFKNRYLQLFPSIFLNYKFDTVSRNTVTLSLTRRINRPSYQYLNPFMFVRDQYTYTTGNPGIEPQYQYRYEMKWNHKRFLRMGLSYNHFTNVIFQTTNVIDGVFITRPENVREGHMLLLNTGLSLNPTKWWNLNSDVLLSWMALDGTAYGERLNPKTYVARINLINQLQFNNGWSAEFGGYYASRDLNGQTFTVGMMRANAGLQKKLWKDKASIRVNMEDIFHSWKYENRSVSLRQAYYVQLSESDTQRIGIAFTYNFGNELFARKSKNRSNALEEEKSRM
jgi:hypothetical protein